MVTSEVWKPVVGYEGIYEVSNMGNVRSLDRTIPYKSDGRRAVAYGKQLKTFCNKAGYYHVNLCNNGTRRSWYVHRIVATAFIDNPDNLPFINHKDENPANNAVENLEWCDAEYNCNYGNHKKRISTSRKNKGARPVMAIDKNTGEVLLFPSLHEAGRNGHSANCVWAAIHHAPQKHGGVKQTYHGYEWRYAV